MSDEAQRDATRNLLAEEKAKLNGIRTAPAAE
jgi:hypothetical protein